MLNIAVWITPQKVSAQEVSVSFQVFYDELSPYGTWVDNSDYGYVWVPNVAPGFTPYATNGHWVFTDEGWTWYSDYAWGWAPFHYGRWYTDPMYGPMWVPDNEWGPGWVTWRRSDDYYGWAPMGPGISVSIAYGSGYYVPNNQWTFVRGRDFGRTNINNYYVNNSNNVTIINNTTVINNTRVDKIHNVTYHGGPDRIEVEKHAGKKFTPMVIKESSRPGQNVSKGQYQIYRPQVQRNISNGAKPIPSKIENIKDVKPAAQRSANTPTQKIDRRDKQPPSKSSIPITNERKPLQPQQSNTTKNTRREKKLQNVDQPNNQRRIERKREITPQQNNKDKKHSK